MARKFCHNTHRYITDSSEQDAEVVPPGSIPPQVVNSFNVEFGYELLSALPYAYYLHERGLLRGTISGVDTAPLYFFSPEHQINPTPRSWDNMVQARKLPNIRIHKHTLDYRFSPPPLKEKYRNDRFVYDKPILCICNRVNIEWNRDIINYFDAECLSRLFMSLKDKYQIIYFNIRGKKEYYDGPQPVDIGDYELAKAYGVINIHDLHEQNMDLSFNELQLMIMANSEKFITMNGGYSILASYMGGTNLIYSKECNELKHDVNSFYRWYHKLGGSRIVHISNYEDLYRRVEDIFVNEIPLINILSRTCNRPNFFDFFYRSIKNQTYKNVNIIAGHHDLRTDKYIVPYPVMPLKYDSYNYPIEPRSEGPYGKPFPSNYYMNHMLRAVKDGLVLFLDDDDEFKKPDALQEIINHIRSEDDLVLWRISGSGRIIPSDENFGKTPVVRDISGISFCCHIKHLRDYVSEPYRWWDYRIISYLYEKLNPVWIDRVLTGHQLGPGYGRKKDREDSAHVLPQLHNGRKQAKSVLSVNHK